MAYEPPNGSSIDLHLVTGYTPPAGGCIILGDPPGGPEQYTPDFDVPWGQYPPRDHRAGSGWTGRRSLARTCRAGWQRNLALLAHDAACGWARPAPKDRQRGLPWDRCGLEGGSTLHAPWRNLGVADRTSRHPWGSFGLHADADLALSYLHPPRMYTSRALAWDAPAALDPEPFDSPWHSPPAKDRGHDTLWGRKYYNEICWRRYEPPAGGAIRLDLDKPLSQVGDKDHVTFYFDQFTYDRRCRWREPSGWRDAYYYIPGGRIPSGEVRRCYFVLNTALLTRLPERTPIDVTSLTVAMDVDSFCWSLSATVGSVAALDLLRPGAPVEVEVNINGHLWIMQVDRWNQSRKFAGGDRSVSGRSRSANLAAPFGPLISLTETQARTAEQLAQAALDEAALAGAGGWTVQWDLVDWLVPANTWTIADQTPMQAIQAIAQAADGIVQTHRTSKVVQVLPRYGVMPWQWSGATPAVIIPEAMILTIDGGFEPKIQFNAAFVAGTTAAGISAKVTRAGSAGDVIAPMVTDPLITDTDAALAKGRGILAASGNWEQQRLSIPLFPAATAPGLVLPGALIQVAGNGNWNGQVIGTSVTASRVRGGVVVRQTLDVERYRGN